MELGFLFSTVVGTILGFLSGLGVGGGSLLILWLTLVLDMDPVTARQINLLFFLPAALISCLFRKKQGVLEIKKLLPALFTGCAAAVLGSRMGSILETGVLKKGFGLLLLATGLREILWKPKKKASPK